MTVWMLALVLGSGLARADETADWQGSQEPDETHPRSLQEVWAEVPAGELLAEALERLDHGDLAGARERLESLVDRRVADLELAEEITYQLAVTCEKMEDFEAALEHYESILATAEGRWLATVGARGPDAGFRRVILLDDLGRADEALDQVTALDRAGPWGASDRAALDLVRGMTELKDGRVRRGLRHTQAGLDALEGTRDRTWLRARGRTALIRYQLDSAAAIEMTNGRQARRRLEQRAALISAAELQLQAVVALNEVEPILEGLILVGDGYLALYDDLLDAPPPRRLTDEEIELNQSELRARVQVLSTKAWRYYDEGVALAERIDWSNKDVDALRQRRDALGIALE